MAVGDIGTCAVTLADGQVQFLLRAEVTAERVVAGDTYTSAVTTLEFAYIDRRAVRSGTLRGYKFDQGIIDEQYLSADPDNPTWHTIRNNMKRFFPDDGGISGGWSP
jgi:hypothetical protein